MLAFWSFLLDVTLVSLQIQDTDLFLIFMTLNMLQALQDDSELMKSRWRSYRQFFFILYISIIIITILLLLLSLLLFRFHCQVQIALFIPVNLNDYGAKLL